MTKVVILAKLAVCNLFQFLQY